MDDGIHPMTKGFSLSTGKRVDVAENDMLYTPREPRGVGVLVSHGAGGTFFDMQREQSQWYKLLQKLAFNGYHVLSADWGGPAGWGNDLVLSRMEAARAYLMTLGCGPKVVLHGGSMGNINCMRFMADHPDQTICTASLMPAIDIVQLRESNPLGIRAQIEAAWGLGSSDPIPHRGIPLERINDMTIVPWAGWYSIADTVTLGAADAALVAALGTDSQAVIVSTTLDHSDPLIRLMPWADMVAWINARVAESV